MDVSFTSVVDVFFTSESFLTRQKVSYKEKLSDQERQNNWSSEASIQSNLRVLSNGNAAYPSVH